MSEAASRVTSVRIDLHVHSTASDGTSPPAAVMAEEAASGVEPGATVGRPHIADAMVAAGLVRDRDEAFTMVLHSRSPYFVRHYAPDAADAVALVRGAGGVPVMAHPLAARRGRTVS